ncbi:hypothetical protein LJC56_08540 [Christensenellaceae bacterium OttesenSCG-928-K19]|nr:hypothetical protein [Christensenellaceae bacterium OttesenSCG-928-K19]
MNFYEQELRRVAAACSGIFNPVFAGRACYGDLGGDNRVKLQFVTLGYADHYEALKAMVLNRSDGEVDTLLFRFSDVWGKKQDKNQLGGVPHIWTYNGKHDWYGYRPNDRDIRELAGALSSYLAVFTVRPATREQAMTDDKESVVEKLRGAKQERAPRKPALAKKDRGPEI